MHVEVNALANQLEVHGEFLHQLLRCGALRRAEVVAVVASCPAAFHMQLVAPSQSTSVTVLTEEQSRSQYLSDAASQGDGSSWLVDARSPRVHRGDDSLDVIVVDAQRARVQEVACPAAHQPALLTRPVAMMGLPLRSTLSPPGTQVLPPTKAQRRAVDAIIGVLYQHQGVESRHVSPGWENGLSGYVSVAGDLETFMSQDVHERSGHLPGMRRYVNYLDQVFNHLVGRDRPVVLRRPVNLPHYVRKYEGSSELRDAVQVADPDDHQRARAAHVGKFASPRGGNLEVTPARVSRRETRVDSSSSDEPEAAVPPAVGRAGARPKSRAVAGSGKRASPVMLRRSSGGRDVRVPANLGIQGRGAPIPVLDGGAMYSAYFTAPSHYQCATCDRSGDSVDWVRAHVADDHNSAREVCGECLFMYKAGTLPKHRSKVHGSGAGRPEPSRPSTCPQCLVVFKNRAARTYHRNSTQCGVGWGFSYKCPYCVKVFESHQTRAKHCSTRHVGDAAPAEEFLRKSHH